MADHADHALQAAVKALTEVVAPSVDPQDPLAVDQLRLVISWLQFDATRRHQAHPMVQAELAQRIALALAVQPLLADIQPLRAKALTAMIDEARAVHMRADVDCASQGVAAAALDTLVSEAILAAADELPMELASMVLHHAHDSVMLRRAWFAPLGFEARPEAVPLLESMLASSPAR